MIEDRHINSATTKDSEDLRRVSVVVTCYNQARFLSESIESVLAQTHHQYEIIVVDDESKDHPEEVAQQYPLVHFISQPNQGVSAARNRGLQESKGRYVIFLDADDRLLPNALEAGVDSFRGHPNCGFVFGRGRLIDSNGKQLPTVLSVYEGGGYEEFLRQNPIGFPALVMYERSALEAINGFRSAVNGVFIGNTADYDLNLRAASRYPVHYHGQLVAEWRVHSNNTSRDSSMMSESVRTVLESQREFVAGNDSLERAWKTGLSNWRRDYLAELRVDRARASARTGDWRRVAGDALWLLWFEPRVLFENIGRKIKATLQELGR